MSFWLGAAVAMAVWQFLNSAVCLAVEGKTVSYTRRMSIGYLILSVGFSLIALLMVVR